MPQQYEILVRKRGENDYAAYCPQLDLVVSGTAHEEVENKMKSVIAEFEANGNAGPTATATS
jgi:predicted RNase H-like HicB family nuclease